MSIHRSFKGKESKIGKVNNPLKAMSIYDVAAIANKAY